MRVLVISAHADDEVYGLGGSIAKHSFFYKDEVYVCILTESVSAQYKLIDKQKLLEYKKIRQKEAENAAKILNIADIYFADFPDMQLDTVAHIKVNEFIKSCIDKVKPQIVYTHYFADVNKDHRLVYQSTMAVLRPLPGYSVKKILAYSIPATEHWSFEDDIKRNVFVDISDYLDIKLSAQRAYKTQLMEFPHIRSEETIIRHAKYMGSIISKDAAEAFILIREII